MNLIELCVPFTVAILGLAYPIILQVIARLDEKYGSDFVALLKVEKEYQWFVLLLKSNLVFLLIYAGIISYIALLKPVYGVLLLWHIKPLILASLVALIISFFYLIRKMMRYYSTIELTRYLIERNKKASRNGEYKYLIALKGLYLFALRQQDNAISETLSNHLYDLFKNHRDKNPDDPEGYPNILFEIIYDIAYQISFLDKNRLVLLEHRVFSGMMLIGEFTSNRIAERTYIHLWGIVKLAVIAKRDDLVLELWQNSFQHYTYGLKAPDPLYSDDYQVVLNEEQISQKRKEQIRFLEFHFALGGLLLSQGRYDCIRRILQFTQSQPPDYILFPQTVGEVYDYFLHFQEHFSSELHFISMRYPFPSIEGMEADSLIRHWISKYMAVLLLNLYTLHQYYITQVFLALPRLPDSLKDRKFLLEFVDYYKKIVKEAIDDKETLKQIGFDSYDLISDEWCVKNNKTKPLELVENLKEYFQTSIEEVEINQTPDPEIVKQFEESNKALVKDTIDEYKPALNTSLITENFKKWSSVGFTVIFDKAAFCKNQGTEYIGQVQFLGQKFSESFRSAFSDILSVQRTKAYLLKENEIFDGIRKLKLSPSTHIIISFGLRYFLDLSLQKGTAELLRTYDNYSFQNIEIRNYNDYNFRWLDRSMFVLKKEDLPYLHIGDTNPETIEKYKLIELDKETKLWGKVIDLYREPDIREEIAPNNPDKDLKKFVLTYLGINTEFRLKVGVQIVQIVLFSDYKQKGLPNMVDDILPFEEKSKS
jgi:hypothetical protein